MLNILTFTTLYPNAAQPVHGIFVENRLRQLVATKKATVAVVAPVPWFPFRSALFGRYAAYASAPDQEVRHGIVVHHPRYPVIPKIGMNVAPRLLYLGTQALVARELESGRGCDVIDAHYLYPDGVTAAMLAAKLGLPFVMTARGSDVNIIPHYPIARRQIAWALSRAAALITVSQDLKTGLARLGAPEDKITVLRNGVDLDLFQPRPRDGARMRLRLHRRTLLSVGNLVPLKGHDLTIKAVATIPDVDLLIVGTGPERGKLVALVHQLGIAGRVRFLGQVQHDLLPEIYSAADALVHASSHEGWPNVLLEANACGTPVVATDVGSAREIINNPGSGILTARRSVDAIASAIRAILAHLPSRDATRHHALQFSWGNTSEGQLHLFSSIAEHRRRAH